MQSPLPESATFALCEPEARLDVDVEHGVYAGEGWSSGVLPTLDGSRNAVFCDPPTNNQRDATKTIELDHVLASVFGLWGLVIPEERRFAPDNQLSLPYPGFSRVVPQLVEAKSRKAGKVV